MSPVHLNSSFMCLCMASLCIATCCLTYNKRSPALFRLHVEAGRPHSTSLPQTVLKCTYSRHLVCLCRLISPESSLFTCPSLSTWNPQSLPGRCRRLLAGDLDRQTVMLPSLSTCCSLLLCRLTARGV